MLFLVIENSIYWGSLSKISEWIGRHSFKYVLKIMQHKNLFSSIKSLMRFSAVCRKSETTKSFISIIRLRMHYLQPSEYSCLSNSLTSIDYGIFSLVCSVFWYIIILFESKSCKLYPVLFNVLKTKFLNSLSGLKYVHHQLILRW